MASGKILGVGSALTDVLARVGEDFLPRVGGEKGGMMMVEAAQQSEWIAALGSQVAMAPGGAAGNTIFGLGHLGLPVAMVSKIGHDEYGAFYRQKLREIGGSDDEFLTTDAATSGVCLSLVTPDSERTMRSYLGASQLLTAAEVAAIDFSKYSLVFIEGYMLFLPEVVETALRCAREAGCKTAMDLASFEVVRIFRDRLTGLLKDSVDFVFANEDEAAALFEDRMTEEEATRELAAWCEVAAVKLGRRGSLIARGSEMVAVPAQLVEPLDTTAAGDLWASGFLYGYLNGRELAECGRIASLVSSYVVTVMGSEMPPEMWNAIKQEL